MLGDYGYASEEIRLKVRRSAERLGYRPNQIARSMITGRTRTIGVVAGDIQSPFYAGIMRGISDVARQAGFGVILTNSDESAELESEAVKLLLGKQVDGLIVAPSEMGDAAHLRRAVRDGIPVVQVDRVVKGLKAASVTIDNRAAARQAVAMLLAAGHRRVGILAELEHRSRSEIRELMAQVRSGNTDVRAMFPTWPRFLGYLDAHEEAGIPVDFDLVARVGTYSSAQARRLVAELLSGPSRPSALFTADGLMTASAVAAVADLGLSIPGELSIIGFDDLDWMSFYGRGITAVAQPLTEIGETAARLMLEMLGGGRKALRDLVLPAALNLRGSVEAPPR